MNMMSKKGDMWLDWPEYVSLVLLIIGFIFALSAGSAFISYVVVFFCGMIFGRLWYKASGDEKFKWFMIIISFLIGFVFGSFYGDKKVIIVLFVLGTIIAYYLHVTGKIKSKQY